MNESYAGRGHAGRGHAGRGHATGGQKSTRAGGVILAGAALLSTLLVILGLFYAAGDRERHKVALAAAGCEPNLLSINVGCTTVQMLDSRYNSIANPVTQQLNADVSAYTASERHHLGAAEAALAAEVTSEKAFDASLARFPFSPAVAPTAKALIRANQALARLTAEQARSSSLTRLRSFNARVKAARAAVQTEMRLTRRAVEARPTVNQEP
jgi:hypothetical protein